MEFELKLEFGTAVVFTEPWSEQFVFTTDGLLVREFSFFKIKLWANCRIVFPFGIKTCHDFYTLSTYDSPLNKENIYLNFSKNLYEYYYPLLFDIYLTIDSYYKALTKFAWNRVIHANHTRIQLISFIKLTLMLKITATFLWFGNSHLRDGIVSTSSYINSRSLVRSQTSSVKFLLTFNLKPCGNLSMIIGVKRNYNYDSLFPNFANIAHVFRRYRRMFSNLSNFYR